MQSFTKYSLNCFHLVLTQPYISTSIDFIITQSNANIKYARRRTRRRTRRRRRRRRRRTGGGGSNSQFASDSIDCKVFKWLLLNFNDGEDMFTVLELSCQDFGAGPQMRWVIDAYCFEFFDFFDICETITHVITASLSPDMILILSAIE
jgi:hypothetical protein